MSVSIKKIFITSLILSQIFISNTAFADSIILNKETSPGVNVRSKKDTNSEILGGIEDFTMYEIKDEDENWYQIDFDGKTGYVGKTWFYRLNQTNIIDATNLKSEANSQSSNAAPYKLLEQTKVTILEFVKDSEFVKVSYDENYKDNRKINVTDIEDLSNNDLLFSLSDDKDSGVKTVTLNDSIKDIPEVVTLSESPQTVEIGKDADKLKEPVTGYVKLSSLAVSKKDKEDLEGLKNTYEDMNKHIKETLEYEESIRNQVIQTTHYETITTYETSQSTDTNTSVIEVPVTGNPVGVELYKWATQFVGRPYVLGGVSLTNGIDCSGFTMQIYRQIGIELPHFAQSQQRYGVEIPFGQEQAGDLVFFGTSLNNITHVAMADGNGNMIHASSPRVGIIISPIRNPISIKRIVQ
ncbi:C40 family peptidase [Anaerococcus sp. Marseille-Q7828]|uniref:C40 family peptidase n=1 Tax=Anaerococcus sp. Marseille-Q7828 TaxID=3036300 RepID=UPI0024AD0745|nr:C40 family peptidase [Anaerococcus sp. Marseille-Q7828]